MQEKVGKYYYIRVLWWNWLGNCCYYNKGDGNRANMANMASAYGMGTIEIREIQIKYE